MLQTKSLKPKEEEDVLRKLHSLETLRKNITDYSNISSEMLALKKQLQTVSAKFAEENKAIDLVSTQINAANEIIFKWQDAQKESTEGERSESDKVRKSIEVNNAETDKLYAAKHLLIAQ